MTTVNLATDRLEIFFSFAFGEAEGLVCIGKRDVRSGKFEDQFFVWPNELPQILDLIRRNAKNCDMWYCPQIFSEPRKGKEYVKLCPSAWSDLDSCPPDRLRVEASVVVQSSPGRYQALWRFSTPVEPTIAEDISRRIAYAHADEGADKTGWDLTQYLRIPFTPNHKYADLPQVVIIKAKPIEYQPKDFDLYEEVPQGVDTPYDFPDEVPELDDVLLLHRSEINPLCWPLISQKPKEDWSTALWKLELLLFESGLSREEVFVVAKSAACNKYERDRRSEQMLWRDVCRAFNYIEESSTTVRPTLQVDYHSDILTDEDRRAVEAAPQFVEEYVQYGAKASDAAAQYHQAGAFVILSSAIASHVNLPTSHGIMPLNLWFMILADTTLTRKSTSMEMATSIIEETPGLADAILATDGSLEGLFAALTTRAGRASVFKRDEVAGFLEAMRKRDYLAGLAEALAALYDGTTQKRILRKETFLIHKPRLIFYTAGIRSKISDTLSHSYVESGFLPRFVLITADGTVDRIRPEGPPSDEGTELRANILAKVQQIVNHYSSTQRVIVGSKVSMTPRTWNAQLTTDAWNLYNKFSGVMIKDADESPHRALLIPTYERLARSGLKAATLVSAGRRLEDSVTVEEEDIIRAFYYVEQWRKHAYSIVISLERSPFEKLAEKALMMIVKEPGISRAKIMTVLKLRSKEADEVLTTLAQRGMVKRSSAKGGNEKLFPIWEPS